MKFFLFSLVLFISACASEYHLQATDRYGDCAAQIKPRGIATSWFDASVDVEGHHLGGLLLIKDMPDQSKRVVFTSEAGATIFDFEYKQDGKFTIRHIISKLNKRVITEVLRKDFELLLGLPFRNKSVRQFTSGNEIYFGVASGAVTDYYVSDEDCNFKRLEEGSSKKRKVSITLKGADVTRPEIITIIHHTFDMVIELKKFDKDAG